MYRYQALIVGFVSYESLQVRIRIRKIKGEQNSPLSQARLCGARIVLGRSHLAGERVEHAWVGASSRLQMFHQWELNPRQCCNIWKAPALSFPQHVVLFLPRIFRYLLHTVPDITEYLYNNMRNLKCEIILVLVGTLLYILDTNIIVA